MVKATVTVSQSGDWNAINEGIKTLQEAVVYVGIPDRETDRTQDIIGPLPKEHITNAGLLYIHTNGSPRHGIPPRPVIEPAIEARKNRIVIESMLMNAADAAFDKRKADANAWVKKTGQFASNASKRWFTDPQNGWKQNAPETIRRKLNKLKSKTKRTSRNKKWLNAMSVLKMVPDYMPLVGTWKSLDSINTPLIDTDQMRRAITWVPKK